MNTLSEKDPDIALVEVFKTNVGDNATAAAIAGKIADQFPDYSVNFDLEDCDKILRIEPASGPVNVRKILSLVKEENVVIEILK